MSKQEGLPNPEDISGENEETEKINKELRQLSENLESGKPQQEEKTDIEDDGDKKVSRRSFLGKITGATAGALFGGKALESLAEGAEEETKEEREKREANKLLVKLFKIKIGDNPEDSSRDRARKKMAMDRVIESNINTFATKKKLGYPKGDIHATVFREDKNAALEVLETNLNVAIETRFRNARKEDETITIEDIKKEIYSRPGIAKLRAMIELSK